MKNFKLYAVISVTAAIFFWGCKKDSDQTTDPDPSENDPIGCVIDKNAKRDLAFMPDPGKQNRDLVLRGIGVEPTPCSVVTPINIWLVKQFTGWSQPARDLTSRDDLKMPYLAIYVAVLFEKNMQEQYFGLNGEYTDQIKGTFNDLKRFWDIEAKNIGLVAAHGSQLRDRNKIYTVYRSQFGLSPDTSKLYTDEVINSIKNFPEYLNGNHPFLTFNAYAHQEKKYGCVGQVPDKLIIGDGFLRAYDQLGYGDIAPQAILAHEFAHQIQYDLGIMDHSIKYTPEYSRRTELMADAYAAYFLAHQEGNGRQWKRAQKFLDIFFNVGDCDFENNLHHGTPNQRRAATEWGANLANSPQDANLILSGKRFAELFDADLPDLIKQ